MKNAILVTARTASTRLPNKALTKLYGEVSLIEHVLKRAKLSKLSNQVILCTTNLDEDEILCKIAVNTGVDYFRGSVEDKLSRWLGAVNDNQIDYFVTMDGDDPFCAPELVDLAFQQINLSKCDFIEKENVITGLFTYAISGDALRRVCTIKDTSDTEMMWTFFKDTGLFTVNELHDVPKPLLRRDIRLTIDYPEDLVMFRKIFNFLPEGEYIDVYSVVKLLSENASLNSVNFFRQKEFEINQKEKTVLRIKS
jgi:spore coat polysaccharide biosynthesis protein SpsF (cytidylyltransferase family)